MVGAYKFKYRGVLKGFDLTRINRDTFSNLVVADIFDLSEWPPSPAGAEYPGMELDDVNWELNGSFVYNHVGYTIKREILEEMFDSCRSRCEEREDLEDCISDIELNINMKVSDYSKIRFLKMKIDEVSQQISDQRYYLLYSQNRAVEEYFSWKDFFESEQVENEHYEFVYKYLKGDKDFVPPFIKSIWPEFFLAKNLTDYCKKKILSLERSSGLRESDIIIEMNKRKLDSSLSTSKKQISQIRSHPIFVENGEEIFEYLVSKSSRKLSKAFFSYLYLYLKSINKIVFLGNDSLEYRTYVMERHCIGSFSRVQSTFNDNSDSVKNRMFKQFDNDLAIFTALK